MSSTPLAARRRHPERGQKWRTGGRRNEVELREVSVKAETASVNGHVGTVGYDSVLSDTKDTVFLLRK